MPDRGNPVIGARLRELRDSHGLTQAEVAAAIGRSRGHISAIENGSRPVGRNALVALSKLYGRSLDFIASPLGEAGGAAPQNDLEAAAVLIIRQLPQAEAEAWVSLMMTRLKDTLKTS